MTVTYEQLATMMPQAEKAGRLTAWAPHLLEYMEEYEITSPKRAAMFLATIAEETGELRAQQETSYFTTDPAYIVEKVFPRLNVDQILKWRKLGKQGFDEAFFNFVYGDANRPPGYKMGNTNPGDGYRYRGRGPMQLTGRNNYARLFESVGMPANSDPDLLLDQAFGARSAAHFWKANGCNQIADTGDFHAATKRVNGGHINMATRLRYYAAAKAALAGKPEPKQKTALTSRTNIALAAGGVTNTTITPNVDAMAPPIEELAKQVLPDAMSAAATEGVVRWILIAVALSPLLYVGVRYTRKLLKGEAIAT